MSKKIFVKTLLPITSVALLGGGIASSLVLSSCSSKKDLDPSHYVGNVNGEDWEGWESGQIQYKLEDGGYTLDLSQSSINYRATD
jgi:hypothetical protein